MKVFVKNTMNGLIPLYPSDLDEKRKLKIGETYEATIKRPRNVDFHKKFFKMVNVGWENTSLEMPFEAYRSYVIQKAGYFNAYKTHEGIMFKAKSIAFENMSQNEFEGVYSRVLDVIIKDIGSTSEEIEEEILNFM